MSLTLEQAEDIAQEATDLLGTEVNVMEEYSGRGMYGKTCIAFTSDSRDAMAAIAYVAATLDIPWRDVPGRIDSLGLGVVIY